MRTLKFKVDGQIITKHPDCDFSDLVPGTEGYLRAEFIFSDEWKDMVKVAKFTRNGYQCSPQRLEDGKSCMIPTEALTSRQFKIGVLGKNTKTKLTTNLEEVVQNGG